MRKGFITTGSMILLVYIGMRVIRNPWVLSYNYYVDLFNNYDHIGGVIVSVLASIVVDRRFDPRSGQPNDYHIGICCFSAKHAALRRDDNTWLARNQNNVFGCSSMSIRGLLFQ
jgi:hypothetical protein